jgi:hypothetical protein
VTGSGGGGGPYGFTLTAPAPAGLSLSPAGSVSGSPTSFGPAPLAVLMTDASGNSQTRTFNLVINRPPAASAGGPYTVDEGSRLTLAGSESDADGDQLTPVWDLDEDGQFDDATGLTPTLASRDGPLGLTVRLRIDDPWVFVVASATVGVRNVAPQAAVTGPSSATVEVPQTWTVSAGDPSAADRSAGFAYAIDWDGDGTPEQTLQAGRQRDRLTCLSDAGTADAARRRDRPRRGGQHPGDPGSGCRRATASRAEPGAVAADGAGVGARPPQAGVPGRP